MMKSRHGLSLAERLERLSIPEPNSGCILWIGHRIWGGYGRIRLPRQGRMVLAHRAAYEAATGVNLASDVALDHLCRVRSCINWRHLEPVTLRENILRGEGIAGRYARRTSCNRGHPYTPENTATYQGARACRTCHRERGRASDARMRARKQETLDLKASGG
jgi:hypothetical protein